MYKTKSLKCLGLFKWISLWYLGLAILVLVSLFLLFSLGIYRTWHRPSHSALEQSHAPPFQLPTVVLPPYKRSLEIYPPPILFIAPGLCVQIIAVQYPSVIFFLLHDLMCSIPYFGNPFPSLHYRHTSILQ